MEANEYLVALLNEVLRNGPDPAGPQEGGNYYLIKEILNKSKTYDNEIIKVLEKSGCGKKAGSFAEGHVGITEEGKKRVANNDFFTLEEVQRIFDKIEKEENKK